jgi:3-phosphoshikimate 1-carboxyvinyltransferase
MKQVLQPVREPIHAKIQIPGSKSISNRALLLAALANGVSEINNLQISDDIRVFVKALADLGISIQLDEAARKAVIGGCNGQFLNKHCLLWCGESGTLARFIVTACAGVSGAFYFDGEPSLRKRPMASLLHILTSQGVTCIPNDSEKLPFTVISPNGLRGGKVFVDGSKTGQVVSALLMIAPFAREPLTVHVEKLVSRSYVDLTCSVMAEFGVQVEILNEMEFRVSQPQHYVARDYQVEPDLSTASYFLAAAALTGGEVTMQAIRRYEIRQGDIEFLNILEKMGCEVREENTGLTVKGPRRLQGIEVSLKDCPDLFMTLAALAPFAKTPTLITDIGHARFKESDRLAAMRKGLERLGVKVEEGEDWFKIYPSEPHGGTINSYKDHRIAMAFAVMSLRVPDLVISGAECVSKSCPEFFQLWKTLA